MKIQSYINNYFLKEEFYLIFLVRILYKNQQNNVFHRFYLFLIYKM